MFAWKGSFAVAGDDVDGHLVSDKFPTHEFDPALVDGNYLRYFFRSSDLQQQALRLSKGAAAISKLTLNPPQFWDLRLPLPSLHQQRALASTLTELESCVDAIRSLQRDARKTAVALVPSSITSTFRGFHVDGQLGDVLTGKPRNGWSAQCDNADFGVPVLALGAVTGFSYRETEFKRTSEPTRPAAHYWLTPGDLLSTRSNTPELVGHAAIYSGTPSPCINPDLMMRVPLNEARADKRFVHYWLQSTVVRDYIAGRARGTSPSMKKIAQGDVIAIPFPVDVPVETQRRVVAGLDRVATRVRSATRLQDEAALAADAILTSAIDRAFVS